MDVCNTKNQSINLDFNKADIIVYIFLIAGC